MKYTQNAPINSNGELVATSGTGDANIAGYLGSGYLPVNDVGQLVIRGLTTPPGNTYPKGRIALIGDSIAYNNGSNPVNTGQAYNRTSNGFLNWAMAFTGHQFHWQPNHNFGISGWTTSQVLNQPLPDTASAGAYPGYAGTQYAGLTQLQAVIKLAPTVCIVEPGINDVNGGGTVANIVPPATTISNIQSMCTQLIAAGITPIIRAITPRSNSSWGAYAPQGERISKYVNAQLRTWALKTPGVYWYSCVDNFVDPTSSTGDPIASMVNDGLHPDTYGAFVDGWNLAKKLVDWALCDSFYMPYTGQVDLYDNTNNVRGNLLNDGTIAYSAMSGTTGTAGTGVTGTVATGYTISRVQGSADTATATIEQTPISVNGLSISTYNRQVLTITSQEESIFQARSSFAVNGTNRNIAVGDNVYAEAEVEFSIPANATWGLLTPTLVLTEGGGTSRQVIDMDFNSSSKKAIITGNFKLMLRTPVMPVQQTTGWTVDLQLKLTGSGAQQANIVAKIGKVSLRKVI